MRKIDPSADTNWAKVVRLADWVRGRGQNSAGDPAEVKDTEER